MVLKIQDKEYLLKYDVNALVKLEDLTGKTLEEILNESIGFSILRQLLFVGLSKYHKEINLEESGDLIQEFLNQGQEIQELSTVLMKSFEESNLVKTKDTKKK